VNDAIERDAYHAASSASGAKRRLMMNRASAVHEFVRLQARRTVDAFGNRWLP
jgi:hypothetical protein